MATEDIQYGLGENRLSSMAVSYSQEYLDEYNGGQAYVTCGVVLFIGVMLLVGRFSARKMQKIRWGTDDYLVICSAVSLAALIGVCFGKFQLHKSGITPSRNVICRSFTQSVMLFGCSLD